MNAGRLFMCVTATAAATAKRTNSAPLTAMDRMVAPIFSLILNVAQRLFRLRLVPALDLNLYRTRREVEAAKQATETDQVLDPFPLGQKANVGGLERQLGGRDQHRVSACEDRHEVEGIGVRHCPLALDPSVGGPLGAPRVPAPAAVPRSPGAPASRSAPAVAGSFRPRALRHK